jgi:hypothetical protein
VTLTRSPRRSQQNPTRPRGNGRPQPSTTDRPPRSAVARLLPSRTFRGRARGSALSNAHSNDRNIADHRRFGYPAIVATIEAQPTPRASCGGPGKHTLLAAPAPRPAVESDYPSEPGGRPCSWSPNTRTAHWTRIPVFPQESVLVKPRSLQRKIVRRNYPQPKATSRARRPGGQRACTPAPGPNLTAPTNGERYPCTHTPAPTDLRDRVPVISGRRSRTKWKGHPAVRDVCHNSASSWPPESDTMVHLAPERERAVSPS